MFYGYLTNFACYKNCTIDNEIVVWGLNNAAQKLQILVAEEKN